MAWNRKKTLNRLVKKVRCPECQKLVKPADLNQDVLSKEVKCWDCWDKDEDGYAICLR